MKKILVILTVSLFMFSSCTQNTEETTVSKAMVKSTIEKITEQNTLRVGTSGEQFPFSFTDDNGELKGLDIEIGKALAKRMGVKVKFVTSPIDQLIPSLKSGKTDIILSGMSVTVQRNMKLAYSNYYFKTGKAILTTNKEIINGNKETINNETINIAVLSKSSSLDFVKREYPNAKITEVKSYEEVNNLFRDNTINAFLSDYEICESISVKNLDINLKIKSVGGIPEYISAAVSPKDVLFLNLVSNFMTKVRKSETEVLIDELWLSYLN